MWHLCRRFEVPTPPAANSVRNFKSKSGTRIIELLVPLCFRSSCQSARRCITNFGNGALVAASLFGNVGPDRQALSIATRCAGRRPVGGGERLGARRLLGVGPAALLLADGERTRGVVH